MPPANGTRRLVSAVALAAVLAAACSPAAAPTAAGTVAPPATSARISAAPATAGTSAGSTAAAPSPSTATASPTRPASPAAPSAATTAAPATPAITPGPSASRQASPVATVAPTAAATPSTAATPAWKARVVEGGPSAREDQTWTVDLDGHYAYLFGGRAGSDVFADLWRFDLAGDRWDRLDAPNAPEPRFGHTATWVPGVGLVVFSGQAGSAFFSDLWAYDPASNSWLRLPDAGTVPEPRYGSCAGLAPDGRLWISHGFTDMGRFFDTRAYDFAKGAWSDITSQDPTPVIRCLHDCVWTADGRFVLYGGQTNGVAALGDLWTRAPDGKWVAQPQPPLAARQLYAVATVNDTAWIFGGANIDGKALGDLWTLSLTDLAWRKIDPGGANPPSRLSATLIADPARNRLLLFGGKSSDATFDDLWELRLGA